MCVANYLFFRVGMEIDLDFVRVEIGSISLSVGDRTRIDFSHCCAGGRNSLVTRMQGENHLFLL